MLARPGLSRRADSNCRPAVYEVVSATLEDRISDTRNASHPDPYRHVSPQLLHALLHDDRRAAWSPPELGTPCISQIIDSVAASAAHAVAPLMMPFARGRGRHFARLRSL